MTQYVTAISVNDAGRRLAQVWVVGGRQVGQIVMPPGSSRSETWDMATWMVDKIVQADLARDQRETEQSVRAASHHL